MVQKGLRALLMNKPKTVARFTVFRIRRLSTGATGMYGHTVAIATQRVPTAVAGTTLLRCRNMKCVKNESVHQNYIIFNGGL